MRIYELRYWFGGEVESNFYATKSEAQHMAQQGAEPELLAHDFEPTRKGVVKLLKKVAGSGMALPPTEEG